MRRRSDIVFPSMLALWTVWHPTYGVGGLVKAATAGLSAATAILMFRLLPEAPAPPTSAAIQAANAALANEIRQRKRAEERFRTLLESAPDGMVIANDAGRIAFANAQTEAGLESGPKAAVLPLGCWQAKSAGHRGPW